MADGVALCALAGAHAAVGATTVATGQHTKQRAAAGTQPSAVGIPVTVLQSVAVATSAPPALQATVQLQGMRADAFDAASTQLRFRQAVSQVVLRSDVFYWKVWHSSTAGSAQARARLSYSQKVTSQQHLSMLLHCQGMFSICILNMPCMLLVNPLMPLLCSAWRFLMRCMVHACINLGGMELFLQLKLYGVLLPRWP